tara:strand:+ start:502 stop:1812 length:1311 start_codon:yes stop_codon:yes gene_type:complete
MLVCRLNLQVVFVFVILAAIVAGFLTLWFITQNSFQRKLETAYFVQDIDKRNLPREISEQDIEEFEFELWSQWDALTDTIEYPGFSNAAHLEKDLKNDTDTSVWHTFKNVTLRESWWERLGKCADKFHIGASWCGGKCADQFDRGHIESTALDLNASSRSAQVVTHGVVTWVSGDFDARWQHFMQNMLPSTIESLRRLDKSWVLIFPKSTESFAEFVLRSSGVQARTLFVTRETSVRCKHLIVIANAFLRFFKVPNTVFESIQSQMQATLCRNPSSPKARERLLYLTRKNIGKREVLNENKLLEMLNNISSQLNLELTVFDHKNFNNIEARLRVFSQARIVVAPHGGAIYHIFACRPRTLLIEFTGIYDGRKGVPCGRFQPNDSKLIHCPCAATLALKLNLDYRRVHWKGHMNSNYEINVEQVRDMLLNAAQENVY